jgi:O-antigen/teichoic acid export membrane protein
MKSFSLKIFGKDAASYGFGIMAVKAVSFLLIPLYTHSLSVKDYGLLATLIITIEILFIFMHMGLRTGFLRFAKEYGDKGEMGKLIVSSILVNIIGGVIVTGASISICSEIFSTIFHNEHPLELILLSCLAALSNSLFILTNTYFRANHMAMKYMRHLISASVIIVVLNLILLLIFHLGIKGVLIAQVLTYSSLFLYTLIRVLSKTGIGISFPLVIKQFHFGFPLIFAMSGSLITDSSSLYLLSYFKQLEDVAIFSLGSKLAAIASIAVISPFQIAYEPFVFSSINKSGIHETIGKLLTYLALTLTFVSFVIILFSRGLISIIAPEEYSSAFLVIIFLLPAVLFRGVYYVGDALFSVCYKTRLLGFIVTAFAGLSIILNYILIPSLGIYGAIITCNFISIMRALLILSLGTRLFPIKIEVNRLGIIAGLFVSFLSLFILLNEASAAIYYSVNLIAAFASITLLFLTGFFTNHEKARFKTILNEIRYTVSV